MPQTNTGKTYLPSKTYDLLKAVLTLAFPAFTTLYLGLASLWDWHNADKVGASIGLVATFLGVVLMISSGRYKNDAEGDMFVSVNPDGTVQPSLSLNKTPEELAEMDQVRFKVQPAPPPPEV